MSGRLVVVAGPSGVGKGTVLRHVLDQVDEAVVAVSATTREPRPGERDGVDYHFLSRAEFEERVARGRFLEWASYHGNLYGTLRDEVDERVRGGAIVVLEIEVQGARQVRRAEPDALLVFLAPPSLTELRRRLQGRETESPEAIEERLRIAEDELRAISEFDHVVVNDEPERAAAEIAALARSAPEVANG